MEEKNVTWAAVGAAYAKYKALRNTLQKAQKAGPFPNFPSGGDPRVELFNTMSRTLEDRTAMIAEAEQVGERRAALRAEAGRKKL